MTYIPLILIYIILSIISAPDNIPGGDPIEDYHPDELRQPDDADTIMDFTPLEGESIQQRETVDKRGRSSGESQRSQPSRPPKKKGKRVVPESESSLCKLY